MDLGEEDMVYRIDMIVVKLKLLIPYSSIERMNSIKGAYSIDENYNWMIIDNYNNSNLETIIIIYC